MKNEIIKKEEELRLAMLSSDVEKLDSLISDALVFIGPDGSVATKQMDLQCHREKLQVMTELTPSEQVIQMHNNFAVVTVKMHISGTFMQNDISGTYRYLRNWAKQDNGWKVVSGCVAKLG